jgi:hypothetical protein
MLIISTRATFSLMSIPSGNQCDLSDGALKATVRSNYIPYSGVYLFHVLAGLAVPRHKSDELNSFAKPLFMPEILTEKRVRTSIGIFGQPCACNLYHLESGI